MSVTDVAASQVVVLMERLHHIDKASGQCAACQVTYPCATITALDGCDIDGDYQPEDAYLDHLRQTDRDDRAARVTR